MKLKLSKDYVVALADGEGSFTAFVRNLKESTERIRRTRIEPRFYIKLVETDKSILYLLKNFFGCGSVYLQKDRRPNHQNCYRYEVFNRKELEKVIIPFFQKNSLHFPSKQKDFKIFCKLMDGIARGDHLTKHGLDRLYRLKDTMH